MHDAVAATVHAVRQSPERYLAATNPAAMLEIVVHRRLADEQHRARMCGMAGAARNGRTSRTSYPYRVGGEQAQRILADVPTPTFEANHAIDRAATRIHDWVVDRLAVELDGDPLHATIYVLERLADGVSRASLLRGGHTALSADPALRHLQFSTATALDLRGVAARQARPTAPLRHPVHRCYRRRAARRTHQPDHPCTLARDRPRRPLRSQRTC